ncbi:uncharacterized protein LY89DRAFT_184048 [Mollisia scopiformis]|uniref:Uncharacterized protein n=1 Tax=Mollisia scopiformis TaxID=149040 RepID=A0A194XUW7_MOLSC|nr:uncharacterized protein LY89DRAFT_184048 [Mollisia scopiformis]KUJ23502.1 hypothetical protein LY89DRAFT_184048 [Mollisia scopiformis]
MGIVIVLGLEKNGDRGTSRGERVVQVVVVVVVVVCLLRWPARLSRIQDHPQRWHTSLLGNLDFWDSGAVHGPTISQGFASDWRPYELVNRSPSLLVHCCGLQWSGVEWASISASALRNHPALSSSSSASRRPGPCTSFRWMDGRESRTMSPSEDEGSGRGHRSLLVLAVLYCTVRVRWLVLVLRG